MAKTLESNVIRKVEELHFNLHDCPSCGILYAIEADFEARRRKDAQTFYCPNGHSIWYGKSEADKLREQVAERDRLLSLKQEQVNGALERLATVERSRAAVQGEVTKLRKRAASGVCPDCNRTFANVALHMRSKHQGHDEAAKVAEEMKATDGG